MKKLKQGTVKVRLGCNTLENAKISYGWGFLSLKMLE